jgi:L-threonylcarbamoyladenylate synthase
MPLPRFMLSAANRDATEHDAARQAAHQALTQGQLVLLPTETVYGIAARADDPAALERLRVCKGRDAAQPLSLHVGIGADSDPALALPESVTFPGIARRLVRAYWPGPLTLIVQTDAPALSGIQADGTVGMRAPYHAFTSTLLAGLDFPVVMSSANAHGGPPAVTVDEALASLGDRAQDLALLVDTGPTDTAQSHLASSVLTLLPGRFELLREGLLNLDELRRTAGLGLGFICTGNTCRSPLAEVFAELELARALGDDEAAFGFTVESMGLAAAIGAPASSHSQAIAKAAGRSLANHRAHQAQLEDLIRLDRVYTMTQAHRDHLQHALARQPHAPLVETLHPDGRDIQDPYGGNRADYKRAANDIRDAIRERLPEWL